LRTSNFQQFENIVELEYGINPSDKIRIRNRGSKEIIEFLNAQLIIAHQLNKMGVVDKCYKWQISKGYFRINNQRRTNYSTPSN